MSSFLTAIIDADMEYTTRQGCAFKIVSTNGCNDTTIKFLDKLGAVLKVANVQIRRGNISNPNHPVVLGVGYFGQGVHKGKENSRMTKEYNIWSNMITRCYDGKLVGYEGCTVCEEWHNFQNFAAWYKEQPHSSESGFEVDKDILLRGNKIYCPEFCRVVPKEINLLIKGAYRKTNDLPVGVIKSGNTYAAQASLKDFNGHKTKWLGQFSTIGEASSKYKEQKELYIKHVANKFKAVLPFDIYEALLTYEVVQ